MRLINATTLDIEEFLSEENVPPFAILSHTWEEEECTLQQMQSAEPSTLTKRKGYGKIQRCCEQALKDGFQWAWVDTCCIDKTSTAELSEAINSMFHWYRIARVCYAFLSDVVTVDSMSQSRWFTRGWTLQELVAPGDVRFYNSEWQYLGAKLDLRREIQVVTAIDEEVLVTGEFAMISIARRMAWAAGRQTTRIEDRAYSLMGIFDINMPLLYGEGHKAFARLQEAIMKISDDQSLFAWGLPPVVKTAREFLNSFVVPELHEMCGIFAKSPADFKSSDRIHVLEDFQSTVPPIMSNSGVRIELQVYKPPHTHVQFAIIYCTMHGRYENYLGFPMGQWGGRWMARCGELVLIAVSDLVKPQSTVAYIKPEVLLLRAPVALPKPPQPKRTIALLQMHGADIDKYTSTIQCAAHATWSDSAKTITLAQNLDTLHAVSIYYRRKTAPESIFPETKPSSPAQEVGHGSSLVITYPHYTWQHRFSAVFPSFALLIGGSIEKPWVEITLILDDEDAEAELKRLHEADAELMRRCVTKTQVLKLLEEKEHPRGERHQSDEQVVLLWYESQALRGGPFKRTSRQGRLMAKAQVGTTSTNLVEHGVVLLVTISPEGDGEHKAALRNLKWWSIDDAR